VLLFLTCSQHRQTMVQIRMTKVAWWWLSQTESTCLQPFDTELALLQLFYLKPLCSLLTLWQLHYMLYGQKPYRLPNAVSISIILKYLLTWFSGNCNCKLFHEWRSNTSCLPCYFTIYMGRRIRALASILFALWYSSWYISQLWLNLAISS